MGKWIAKATYEDGTEIEKEYPYTANGNYYLENEEQHKIECELIEDNFYKYGLCTWYSVDYTEV